MRHTSLTQSCLHHLLLCPFFPSACWKTESAELKCSQMCVSAKARQLSKGARDCKSWSCCVDQQGFHWLCVYVSHRHLDVNKYVSEACGRAEFWAHTHLQPRCWQSSTLPLRLLLDLYIRRSNVWTSEINFWKHCFPPCESWCCPGTPPSWFLTMVFFYDISLCQGATTNVLLNFMNVTISTFMIWIM